jgi:pantoate kinase
LQPNTASAFCPGGISSFFEICDRTSDGQPIIDLEKMGARGGGFVIQKGVHTHVSVSEAKTTTLRVFINGKQAPEAETSLTVAKSLLAKAGNNRKVTIRHRVDVPIGAGFGSSAGGALSTALALSEALGLKFTYNQLGRIAHVAEIKCKTGLGTVGPIMFGGCILTVEPGGPGVGVIDRIPLHPEHVIVAGTFSPMPTKNVLLSSPEKKAKVSILGRETLDQILADPSAENFMACCFEFAERAGFFTARVKKLARSALKAGAIGATQNMVGEAVHALTREENAESVTETFEQFLPRKDIIVAKIDFQGARLLST